jgi:transcriptional regulator with XRE-family HTH domain
MAKSRRLSRIREGYQTRKLLPTPLVDWVTHHLIRKLAERVQVARNSINAVENGKVDPSLPLAVGIADAFELKMEDPVDATLLSPFPDALRICHRRCAMAGWNPIWVLVFASVATPVLAQTRVAPDLPVRQSWIEVGGGFGVVTFLGEGGAAFPTA